MKRVIWIAIPIFTLFGVLAVIVKRLTKHKRRESRNCACPWPACCERSCSCACCDKVDNWCIMMCPAKARTCIKVRTKLCTWFGRTGNILSIGLLLLGLMVDLMKDFTMSNYLHDLSIYHLVVLFLLVLITVVLQSILLLLLFNLIIEVTSCDMRKKNDEESLLLNRADWTSRDKTKATPLKYTVFVAVLSLATQLWLHEWLHHPAFPSRPK